MLNNQRVNLKLHPNIQLPCGYTTFTWQLVEDPPRQGQLVHQCPSCSSRFCKSRKEFRSCRCSFTSSQSTLPHSETVVALTVKNGVALSNAFLAPEDPCSFRKTIQVKTKTCPSGYSRFVGYIMFYPHCPMIVP